MKQLNTVIIVLLVFLVVIGWGVVLIVPDHDELSEYEAHLTLAEDYESRGLYQKAAREYEAAVSISNNEESWAAMLKVYDKYYAEDTKIYHDYLEAAQNAVHIFGKNADFIMTLSHLYCDMEEYSAAYKCLEQAIQSGVEDERIADECIRVKYMYEVEWESYSNIKSCVNGYYAVNESGIWSYVSEDGSEDSFGNLEIAGAVGDEGIRYVYDGSKSQLIDADRVVQGYMNFIPEDVGIYSEGLIAVKRESYGYYDVLGDKKLGDYEMAGTFVNGQAAVQQNGAWYIIDCNGEKVLEAAYEDIILNKGQRHLTEGAMLAKNREGYRLYDGEGNEISEAVLSDVDIITEDGLIAYCEGGKWGFMDLKGNVVLKPVYDKAKSFSNGLAAVFDGKLWGFIDTEGRTVIDYEFLDADYFNAKGACMVKTAPEQWRLIVLYLNDV